MNEFKIPTNKNSSTYRKEKIISSSHKGQSVFESTDKINTAKKRKNDELIKERNERQKIFDAPPEKKPVIIKKQENTIFRSKLEEQAFKELTTKSGPNQYKTNMEENMVQPIIEVKKDVKIEKEDQEKEESQLSKVKNNPIDIGEAPDYSKVSINDFGLGMLLGMGWSKSTGIGKTFKSNTQIYEAKRRPTGLGLGAKLEDRENQSLFAIGDYVKIIEGKYENKKGVVTDMDVANVRVTIQTKSGKRLEIPEVSCKIISKAEAELKEDKVNNDKAKSKKDNKPYEKNPDKIVQLPTHHQTETKQKLNAYERVTDSFLHPNIKVRLIDENHPDYKEKFVIRSVLTPYRALLENGKEFHQIVLETVVPKSRNSRICIIKKGEFFGCVGLMNERNKKKETVVIDFWDSLSNHYVKEFTFDEVSEYVD